MHKLLLTTAVLLTILITIGSLITVTNVVQIKVSNSDKIIHLLAYFILTFNWLLVFKQHLNVTKKIIFVGLAVIIYGIIIEGLQGLTTYRESDSIDILANSIGVVAALMFFKKYFLKKTS
ncbi:VanZ family protein [Lutibacter sp. TH_r2]|uniref:VanZ family protein n=1 Tax=Lutibacter sp. TH_r2 TaxID=3082083 RepID=UPI0029531490|nr:VanZ family protein [Lutibacter sp. TH_r2]MDV7186232.1 VanZ family protein [Lutibacter sp. TH_r2]